jgi:hypothetical protein
MNIIRIIDVAKVSFAIRDIRIFMHHVLSVFSRSLFINHIHLTTV